MISNHFFSLQTTNLDFIRVFQIFIATSDDPYSVEKNLERMKKNTSVDMGKLEHLNFDKDIKKHHEQTSTTLVNH